jgi:hypothetical protein
MLKEATPIFVDAVTKMSFADARGILMGNESSATNYLQNSTSTALYGKFNPVKNSFTKVGADKVWTNIITKYNSIPLVRKVNPDLTDYVTNQALNGVLKWLSKKKISEQILAPELCFITKSFRFTRQKDIILFTLTQAT